MDDRLPSLTVWMEFVDPFVGIPANRSRTGGIELSNGRPAPRANSTYWNGRRDWEGGWLRKGPGFEFLWRCVNPRSTTIQGGLPGLAEDGDAIKLQEFKSALDNIGRPHGG